MASQVDELVEVEVAWLDTRPRNPPQPTVIDLTDEPDSPPITRPPRREQSFGSLRARRTNSLRRSPPSLNRTDSSTLAGNHTDVDNLVIDLTREPSPDPNLLRLPMNPAPTLEPNANPHHGLPNLAPGRRRLPFAERQRPFIPRMFPDALEYLNALNVFGDAATPGRYRGAQALRHFMGNAPDHNPIDNVHLDYHHPAFPPAPVPPPPPRMSVPPAREGFTRDTGEDVVVICPACDEELEYDPTEGKEENGKKRAKRDKGEHHFWAVKACGHVYCQSCFENRRPTTKNQSPFRAADGSSNLTPQSKVFCAVDDCKSEVTNKGAWVGIFL
ncbi:hypothetical protein jhhlp_000139 [Lomentospora prolificans]|uniref:Cell cycle control protein n=1 Tax=Lomentospora prolificans TaxID=41688 RepID=A0A2N3NLS6_9PEZI|nr:hypothetical protein jhhlp_000139 [Lomentospora prolificans]